MFRKVMQIDDDVIWRYFELLELALERRDRRADEPKSRRGESPLEIKALFAQRDRRALPLGRGGARRRSASSRARTPKHGVPDEVAGSTRSRPRGDTLWIAKALSLAGLVKIDERRQATRRARRRRGRRPAHHRSPTSSSRGRPVPPARRLEEPALRERHRRSNNVSPCSHTPLQQMW